MITKIIILILLAVSYIVIEFIYGGKSKFEKDTFKICTDPVINKAFETVKVKCIHFVEELLFSYGIRSFSLKLSKNSGSGAMVNPLTLTITLNSDYSSYWNIKTFQTCIHEVKHVLDKKILRLTIIPFALFILSFLFFVISISSVLPKGINLKDFYLIAFLVGVTSLAVYITLKIIIEVRAIKYVPTVCKNILNGYGFSLQEQDSIYDYLYSRSLKVLKWYPANLIEQFIMLAGLLDLFYILGSLSK